MSANRLSLSLSLSLNQSINQSINLKLTSKSLFFLNRIDPTLLMPANVTIKLLLLPNLLVILLLSSTHLSRSQIMIFHPCLNHAFYPFKTFAEFGILSTIHNSNHRYVSHSFQGRLLQLSFSMILAVNVINFNLFSTLHLGLFLKPLVSTISPILKSLHWLKIDHRIQYKVLSHLQNNGIVADRRPHASVSVPPRHIHTPSAATSR